jgi:hypothetical protein
LNNDELAVMLGHIARHRGFRSNSKRDTAANAADETSKMQKAMEEAMARQLEKSSAAGPWCAPLPDGGVDTHAAVPLSRV